jgi:site-specific recombinase XerD
MTLKRKPSTPLSREAEAFIEMLSAERGASLNTTAAYGADLKISKPSWRGASARRSTPMPRRCAPT